MTPSLEALLTRILPGGLYRCDPLLAPAIIETMSLRFGWRYFHLDGTKIASKADFLTHAASLLNFPSYFGHNWDAFEECLNDLSWHPSQPALLLYTHATHFATADPGQFATALSILALATQNRETGPSPLAIIIQGATGATQHLPALHNSDTPPIP